MGTIRQRGFTLVELSIVLVILGLLIGGVLTGQSLIRAAELRSVTSQHQRFLTAMQTFRDKYMGLPGDLTNAKSYWGSQNPTDAGCITSISTERFTCNGDGNGRIDLSVGAAEYYRAWQHLANAGLIEGAYTGATAAANPQVASAANSPAGRISGTYWQIFYNGTMVDTNAFAGEYGNAFLLGTLTAAGSPSSPAFKPEEAYNIDMKVDDGKPATGLVAIYARNGLNTCTDAASAATLTASYLLTSSATSCAIYFRNQF